MSYDSKAILKEFSDHHGISYPLLADPQSAIIKRFGVLNPDATDFMKGMAFPGYIYIAPDGRIQQTFFERNYRERYTANNVIATLFLNSLKLTSELWRLRTLPCAWRNRTPLSGREIE